MITKNDKYTVLIVVLSVLLAIALIAGSTFAWFYSNDYQTRDITLGDPVKLSILNNSGSVLNKDNGDQFVTISGSSLLPGMPINIFAKVRFDKSNTPALLRARINLDVQNSSVSSELLGQMQTILNASLETSVASTGTDKWVYYDGWWYYLGSNQIIEPKEESVVRRIDCDTDTESDREIEFINNHFSFPTEFGNEIANTQLKFTVYFQGMQGYLPEFEEPGLAAENEDSLSDLAGYRINKIKNIYEIFDSAFDI